jgi:hypothetical protein
MSKSAEERMMQRIYTGIIERTKTIIFCGVYLLDYKMVQTKHKLGDMITIKSIIENLLVLINILKIKKTLIKPT